MVAQLFPQRIQVLDLNGDPVAAGSIVFYRTGTTTLLTLYSDSTATTMISNPVDLDGNGLAPQVFFDEAYAAKAVVRDVSGAELYTLDPCFESTVNGSAASEISFTPVANNSATDVQAAIEANSDAIALLTTNSFATLDSTDPDAIELTSNRGLTTLPNGIDLSYEASVTNTGAVTFDIDGLGAIAGKTVTGADLPAGYIRTDVPTRIRYDGSVWTVYRQQERINNANGTAIRTEDGEQKCYHQLTLNFSTASEVTGSWTFPSPFEASSQGVVSGSIQNVTGATPNAAELGSVRTPNPTNTTNGIELSRVSGLTDFQSGDTVIVNLTAAGVWY